MSASLKAPRPHQVAGHKGLYTKRLKDGLDWYYFRRQELGNDRWISLQTTEKQVALRRYHEHALKKPTGTTRGELPRVSDYWEHVRRYILRGPQKPRTIKGYEGNIDMSASGAPAYQANWPDLNPPYEEWKKNPLSEEETEQLQGILTSVDRFDGFDKASKKLLDRVAQLWMPESDEAFQFTKEDRGKDSPLLLGGEAYTGFTRLGTNFRRWKNGKEVYSVSYYLDNPAAHKIMEATYKEGDLISMRYWNSRGNEVKSLQEATKE